MTASDWAGAGDPFPLHHASPRLAAVTVDGHTWTVEEMRLYAEGVRDQHTPSNQEGNGYDRCAHCHYTRHPCDTYDLASMVLALIERITT